MNEEIKKTDTDLTATNLENTANRLFLEANFCRLHISKTEQATLREHVAKDVEVHLSDNNVPRLTLKSVNIYESEDPIAKTKRQVDLIEGDDNSNVVALFGFGLGYHAEQLERRFSCPLIVYDPSLDAVSATLGRRMLNLKNTILVTDTSHLVQEIQPRLQFNDRKIVAAAIPAYQQLFQKEFKDFVDSLQQARSNAHILENTTAIRSPDWIYHAVKNVVHAADKHPIDVLCDKFVGKPGILVSAGPSLDKNIHALKAAQGKAVIIAVNAAAAPLARAGIKPDIIAVVEGLDLRAQLENLPWLSEVTLVPTLNCFPGFFEMGVRRILPLADYSVTCSDWFSRAYNWRHYASGGSVACSAFSLMHAFGCDPLVLIGQDLAYTDGKSYTAAATFGKQTMRYDEKTGKLIAVEADRNEKIEAIRTRGGLSVLDHLDAQEVEAYGGHGIVYSIGIFNLFRSWFETTASSMAVEKTLINATEGGARIHGFAEIPLQEVVSKYCNETIDVAEITEQAVGSLPKNDIAALTSEILRDMKIIKSILEVSNRTKKVAEDGLLEVETAGIVSAEPYLRRLSQLETELRALTRKNRIVDAFVSGKVNRLRHERNNDKDADVNRQTANSLKRTMTLLDLIGEGCTELRDLFDPLILQLQKME